MINTEIINFLSEVDTNVFLFFNGIHSPFWDYFMSAFTGKIIWVPMYATIHIANQFPLEGSPVLCGCDRAYHNLCRPDVQQYHPSGRGTSASCQSGKSDCRPGAYRKRLSRRKLRFSFLSCRQLFRPCYVCSIPVP